MEVRETGKKWLFGRCSILKKKNAKKCKKNRKKV